MTNSARFSYTASQLALRRVYKGNLAPLAGVIRRHSQGFGAFLCHDFGLLTQSPR